jgi:molybdopterin-guanine dinucleotide biosynthesis protein A
MGGVDKGLIPINDRPMIAYVIDALRPQVSDVLINANRNHDIYSEFGCAVITDGDLEFRGPLAGIASGMRTARTPYVAFVPCDSPLLCADLVPRLYTALSETGLRIAVAHDGGRLQPVFALLDRGLIDDLTAYLDDGGRKIAQWYEKHGYATVDFGDVIESFSNINEPADKQVIEDKLARSVHA